MFEVDPKCLIEPSGSRLLRPVVDEHAAYLYQQMGQRRGARSTLLCHLPGCSKTDINITALKQGELQLEVLGGNHRRASLLKLLEDLPDDQYFRSWPVEIYCGLSDDQAVKLAFDNNKAEEASLHMSYENLCQLFREQLKIVVAREGQMRASGGLPCQLDSKLITKWRRQLAGIMGLKVSTKSSD